MTGGVRFKEVQSQKGSRGFYNIPVRKINTELGYDPAGYKMKNLPGIVSVTLVLVYTFKGYLHNGSIVRINFKLSCHLGSKRSN